MSDTPRTDEAWAECKRQGGEHEPFHGPLIDECQKLERELAALTAQLAEARRDAEKYYRRWTAAKRYLEPNQVFVCVDAGISNAMKEPKWKEPK